MPDIAADLRAILDTDFGEPVTLSSGAVVYAVPGLATGEENLGGDVVITSNTRTLRFATADVPGLKSRDLLSWGGKPWRVIHVQLAAMGNVTRAYLGSTS